MHTDRLRRWFAGALSAGFLVCAPVGWTAPSTAAEAGFVIGVDTSTAAALQAWAESVDNDADQRFDEQIFTDISPLIESEDAVKLPGEASAEE